MGGCFESKAYSRVKGRWVGQCDDLRRMYFLDDPQGGSVLQKRHLVFPLSTICNIMYLSFSPLSEQVFSSERMLYSTQERFAMKKSFAVKKKVLS